jgi:hypothetical protein
LTKSYWVFLLAAVLLIASTVALIFGQAWNSTKDTKADIEARNGITVEAIEYPLKLTMNEKRDNAVLANRMPQVQSNSILRNCSDRARQ